MAATNDNIVFRRSIQSLSVSEVEALISDVQSINPSLVMSKPPVKPCGGDIIVYQNPLKPHDWKSDQYLWRNKSSGTKTKFNCKRFFIRIAAIAGMSDRSY